MFAGGFYHVEDIPPRLFRGGLRSRQSYLVQYTNEGDREINQAELFIVMLV